MKSRRALRRWALWQTPRVPLALILVVELVGIAGLGAGLVAVRMTIGDFVRFAILLLVAIGYAEAAGRIDRMRRYLAGSTSSAAEGLWCFAAALVLPIGLAGAFTVLVYGHAAIGAIRHQSRPLYRMFYVGSTVLVSTLAVAAVLLALDPETHLMSGGRLAVAGVVLALVIYPLINQVLVTGVIYLVARPTRLREVMLNLEEQGLELATLCVAILLAEALLKAPLLAPLSIVLVIVLRRSALVRTLQQQAMHDAKTGLLNAAAWRAQSEQVLKRAARDHAPVSMLVIDLDHFKRLNDSHGHLAGDNALRVVAGAITETLRGSDVVGRYGGEEFVALLPGVDLAGGHAAAERVCARIRELVLEQGGSVSASIGVSAADHAEGLELDTMLGDADAAMYRAKSAGRDQVAVGRQFSTTGVGAVAA